MNSTSKGSSREEPTNLGLGTLDAALIVRIDRGCCVALVCLVLRSLLLARTPFMYEWVN